MEKLVPSLTEDGKEILDQTPVSLPVSFQRPEPMHIRLRRMILQEIAMQHPEHETFEDACDFNVDDGYPSLEDFKSDSERRADEFMDREAAALAAGAAADSDKLAGEPASKDAGQVVDAGSNTKDATSTPA